MTAPVYRYRIDGRSDWMTMIDGSDEPALTVDAARRALGKKFGAERIGEVTKRASAVDKTALAVNDDKTGIDE